MGLPLSLVAYAAFDLYHNVNGRASSLAMHCLAPSAIVIAMAVFDMAKYFLEEEVVRGRELRIASEARRSLTKFVSTISIAVFIEALVTVVRVSKQDIDKMIYPPFSSSSTWASIRDSALPSRCTTKRRRSSSQVNAESRQWTSDMFRRTMQFECRQLDGG